MPSKGAIQGIRKLKPDLTLGVRAVVFDVLKLWEFLIKRHKRDPPNCCRTWEWQGNYSNECGMIAFRTKWQEVCKLFYTRVIPSVYVQQVMRKPSRAGRKQSFRRISTSRPKEPGFQDTRQWCSKTVPLKTIHDFPVETQDLSQHRPGLNWAAIWWGQSHQAILQTDHSRV